MSDTKKFGLLMPKKPETLKTRISSIFNDESDEDEQAKKRFKIPQKKMKQKSSIKIESDLDPSIYEYDSIYDDMKAKEAESCRPKEIKKSRYIETLMKAADKRKKEYERRVDKKIQIEREKEGDQFKDKEAFVTTSYKKKLQEKEEEEERERRENMLNDMMDVTKQKDLSGFYRHFLNQTIGEEKVPSFGEKQIKKEIDSDQESNSDKIHDNLTNLENLDRDSDGIEIDNEDDDSERDFSSNETDDHENKRSNFRNKKIPQRDTTKINKKNNLSINTLKKKETSGSPKHDKTSIRCSSINSKSEDSLSDVEPLHSDKVNRNKEKHNSRHDSSSSDDENNMKSTNPEEKNIISREEKQKSIYAKRTIGNAFAEAQARYFQRLAMRNS